MNKTVLVTGSAKGIGKDTILKFAKHGYNVVITYLSSEKQAKDLKESIDSISNTSSLLFKVDITNEEEVKNMRLDLREKVCKEFWLKVAFRENMPESNIVYELDKSNEEILAWFNDWARQKVRKWLY